MSKLNLVAKLEAWAAWCHTRNLKAELQRDIYAASERITELEAENKMLHRSLTAKPDTATSSGAAQAAMEYEIDLRERRITELESRLNQQPQSTAAAWRQAKRITELEAEVERLRMGQLGIDSVTQFTEQIKAECRTERERAEKAEARLDTLLDRLQKDSDLTHLDEEAHMDCADGQCMGCVEDVTALVRKRLSRAIAEAQKETPTEE